LKRSFWRSSGLQALLLCLFATSELACSYLWLGWLSGRTLADLPATAVSWPLSIALMLLALIVGRRLLDSALDERRAAGIVVACAVVTAILTAWQTAGYPTPHIRDILGLPDALARTPAADLALLFVAWIWWRSVAIARSDLHFEDASLRLTVGTIACTLALALSEASGTTLTSTALIGLILLFFACALHAVALARLRDVRIDLGGKEMLPASREWLGMLSLVVASIIALAVLLSAVTLLDARHAIVAILNPLADALLVALYVVLLPIGFLAALAIYALRALIALTGGNHLEPFSPPPSPTDLVQNRHMSAGSGIPPALVATGKWAVLGVITLIAIAVIVRAVFRYQRQRGSGVEEFHESLWPGGSPWVALLRWLRDLFRRTRALPVPASAHTTAPARDPGALTVRELYRRWLTTAAARGYPRAPNETADEYLATGLQIVPDAADALQILTRAYDRARYGPQPPDPTLPEAARDAWQQIATTLATETSR